MERVTHFIKYLGVTRTLRIRALTDRQCVVEPRAQVLGVRKI